MIQLCGVFCSLLMNQVIQLEELQIVEGNKTH